MNDFMIVWLRRLPTREADIGASLGLNNSDPSCDCDTSTVISQRSTAIGDCVRGLLLFINRVSLQQKDEEKWITRILTTSNKYLECLLYVDKKRKKKVNNWLPGVYISINARLWQHHWFILKVFIQIQYCFYSNAAWFLRTCLQQALTCVLACYGGVFSDHVRPELISEEPSGPARPSLLT